MAWKVCLIWALKFDNSLNLSVFGFCSWYFDSRWEEIISRTFVENFWDFLFNIGTLILYSYKFSLKNRHKYVLACIRIQHLWDIHRFLQKSSWKVYKLFFECSIFNLALDFRLIWAFSLKIRQFSHSSFFWLYFITDLGLYKLISTIWDGLWNIEILLLCSNKISLKSRH